MKKPLIISSIALLLAVSSCQNTESHDPAMDSVATGGVPAEAPGDGPMFTSNDPALQQGAELVNGSDCATCHRVAERNIGPSFNEVANKYDNSEGMVDELATKIIRGGYGRWGEVAMPPHENISMQDARSMARYVLSLESK